MNVGRTVRERARAELTREIKEEARRQLAAGGAQRLSLRAVARQLGMASSALYRYFPSRDDLLTALIIDAYDRSGPAPRPPPAAARPAMSAAAGGRPVTRYEPGRLAHPHEYALIYGSPVPGYRAPQETVGPAGRVAVVIGQLLRDAWAGGWPAMAAASEPPAAPAAGAGRPGRAGRRGDRARRPRAGYRPQPDRLDAAVRDDQLRAVRPAGRERRSRATSSSPSPSSRWPASSGSADFRSNPHRRQQRWPSHRPPAEMPAGGCAGRGRSGPPSAVAGTPPVPAG